MRVFVLVVCLAGYLFFSPAVASAEAFEVQFHFFERSGAWIGELWLGGEPVWSLGIAPFDETASLPATASAAERGSTIWMPNMENGFFVLEKR